MIPNDRSREATRTLATLNELGACVGAAHPDWWYPERGRDDTVKAQSVCADCPVKAMCLTYALSHEEEGVWGGTTEFERAESRRLIDRIVTRAPGERRAPRRAAPDQWVALPGLGDEWFGGESA